jgi:hypothetical protein
MSAINTGYQSQVLSTNTSSLDKMNKVQLPVYKYLDIDSTYRNRTEYPDANSFVIRNANSSSVSGNNLVVNNLPFYSFPFSQLYPLGSYSPLIFQSGGTNGLTLDNRETITIENFYAGYLLECIIGGVGAYSEVEYATIASYSASAPARTVTLVKDLSGVGVTGGVTNYCIRKSKPVYLGYVSNAINSTTFVLSNATSNTSFPQDSSLIYYLRVRSCTATPSLNNVVVQASVLPVNSNPALGPIVAPNTIQIVTPLPNLAVADSIELVGPGQNIITPLRYASGGAQSIQGGDYELELLWLSVPNQVLDVGYGGTLDRYPYIYCSLYTGITNTTQQVLYSNNPHTSRVLFKVPINEYFGDTSFITLKDSKAKQTIYFDPSQDLFFQLTLPDGQVISFNESDNMPPYPPNPFLQINLLVSMKRV